jgi:protein-S-isoprenylcysteine O-methyltransferase Ste14
MSIMKNYLFLILAGICICAHIVRTIYEILKHRKRLVPDKYSFIIVFINMILLWVSWFLLCSVDPFRLELPSVINYMGLMLVLIGVLIFLVAFSTIKSLETYEGDLITHGIYSRIRHPMYLAFILWLIGMPVFYGAYFSLGMSILLIVNVLLWRHLEELELINRYIGYREYRQRTLF